MDELVRTERRFGFRLAAATLFAASSSTFLFFNERHILDLGLGAGQAMAAAWHGQPDETHASRLIEPTQTRSHPHHLRSRLIETAKPDFAPHTASRLIETAGPQSTLPEPILVTGNNPYFLGSDPGLTGGGLLEPDLFTSNFAVTPHHSGAYIGPHMIGDSPESFILRNASLAAATPEPSTWCTLIGGMIVAGGVLRRLAQRKRRQRARQITPAHLRSWRSGIDHSA